MHFSSTIIHFVLYCDRIIFINIIATNILVAYNYKKLRTQLNEILCNGGGAGIRQKRKKKHLLFDGFENKRDHMYMITKLISKNKNEKKNVYDDE